MGGGKLVRILGTRKMPELTEQIVLLSLRHMAGLACGLSEIHNFRVPCDLTAIVNASPRSARYRLHGDIKPRNILYYRITKIPQTSLKSLISDWPQWPDYTG
jgi:hypothetical protein